MGIRDIFKQKVEPERERSLQDSDQILAWFEELCRIRTAIEVRFSEKDLTPILAKIERVGEETHSCTLSFNRAPREEPSTGQQTEFIFPLDGLRFVTTMTYQGRGRYLEYRFNLPSSIRHAERRDSIRAIFRSSREKHSVLVLQDLFEGVGLNGDLLDLSLSGCAFLIHRAIRIQSEKRLPIKPDLLEVGTPLTLVRLPDLPRLPLVECSGRVSHLGQGPQGVILGMCFENLGSHETQILALFLKEKIPGFRIDFPWKRRFKDLSEEERQRPQESLPEEVPLLPEDDAEAFSDSELSELRDVIHVDDKLKTLKKRGKRILLALPDDLQRTILMGAFYHDGYRSIFEASSLIQALEAHRKVPLDLVLVDQNVGPHSALALIEALRAQGLPKTTPILVLQRHTDVRLTLAAKAGGISLLVEAPVDFQEKLRAPLEDLLGLNESTP